MAPTSRSSSATGARATDARPFKTRNDRAGPRTSVRGLVVLSDGSQPRSRAFGRSRCGASRADPVPCVEAAEGRRRGVDAVRLAATVFRSLPSEARPLQPRPLQPRFSEPRLPKRGLLKPGLRKPGLPKPGLPQPGLLQRRLPKPHPPKPHPPKPRLPNPRVDVALRRLRLPVAVVLCSSPSARRDGQSPTGPGASSARVALRSRYTARSKRLVA
jgi:hypothetical protein